MADLSDLIVAAAMIDEIEPPDGRPLAHVLGGAGLHALAGAALWSADPVLVSGAGEDAGAVFGPWFAENRVSMRGMRQRPGPTPVNRIVYASEDSRTERSVLGAERLALMHPTPDDIVAVSPGARSAYVFARMTDGLLACLARLRAEQGLVVLWEIALDAATPDNLPAIRAAMAGLDAFSLNLDEARRIFGDHDETALVARLRDLGAPTIFLRLGRRGSIAITAAGAAFVPSVAVTAIDVTGGGNAYSGGALAALAAGDDAVTAARKGTVSAALCVSQRGVFSPRAPLAAMQAQQFLSALKPEPLT